VSVVWGEDLGHVGQAHSGYTVKPISASAQWNGKAGTGSECHALPCEAGYTRSAAGRALNGLGKAQ
jgi:hypothetical protein